MALLKNIESVDLSTFAGRLYFDIYNKYGSVNNFCKQNNLHYTKISEYVNNKIKPNIEIVLGFKNFGLDLDFLINGKKEDEYNQVADVGNLVKEPSEINDSGEVDVLIIKGFVSAGHGAFTQDKFKIEKFPKAFMKGIRKPAMIKASGESMMPIIDDGDTLVFEQVHSAKNGNTIICTYGDDVFVKKYIQTPKHLCLRSLNNKFEDIEIETEKLIIHGVVKKIIKSL